MDIWQIITLAVLQGLTEFLPVSSSAHLILVPHLTGWDDQGIVFDVALHVGTLIAVLLYFRQDLKPLTLAWLNSLKSRQLTPESRLVWGVIIGVLPASVLGLLLSVTGSDSYLRSPFVVAGASLFFALLLGWADYTGKHQYHEYQMTWKMIIIIGIAQALALIPGTSRSGVTITAGLFLGLQRQAAARFSFLLSIPVMILAGTHEMGQMLIAPSLTFNWTELLFGITVSALTGYLCIRVFIGLLDRIGMLPFVVYRILLGSFLILWLPTV